MNFRKRTSNPLPSSLLKAEAKQSTDHTSVIASRNLLTSEQDLRSLGNQVMATKLQAKLELSQSNDKYEQEADRIANQIVNMKEPETHTSQRNVRGTTNSPEQVLKKPDSDNLETDSSESINLTRDLGPGRPLDTQSRSFMDPRFAQNFSQVRIHTDTKTAKAAQAINAKAFTIGRDIVFGTGKFQPQLIEGKRLIAHELTHVVQQSNSRTGDKQGQSSYAPVHEKTPPRIARQGLESAEEAKRKKLVIQNVRLTLDEEKEIDVWFEKLKSGRWGTTKDLGLPVKLNGIDDSYRTPMTSIASMLVDAGLKPNKILTVNLNLKKHGLADAIYRFSWVGTAKKGTVYIELLGAGPKAETKPKITKSKDGKTPRNGTITIGKLTFNYKNWDAGQLSDLERALSLTPMSALEKVDGMNFEIKVAAGSTTEDGKYDLEKHTVIVFSKTWKESAVRMGESTRAVDLITHEIGHAVDLAPIRVAAAPLKSRSLSGVKVSSKTIRIYEPRVKRVTKGLDKGKLAVGETDFRKAAEKDGVEPKTKKGKTLKLGVTEYGKTDYQQLFAESFTLYVNDPDLFKLIRPNIYDYFLKHYPRKPVDK